MKKIIILIAELSLCGFAMYSCIYQWVNNPDSSSRGTDPLSFVTYIALAIFFIVLYIKDKK